MGRPSKTVPQDSRENQVRRPTAVLISDIHYNLSTLELADACLNLAFEAAEDFRVPLIIAGDLHDTKGALRAECVNRILDTFIRHPLVLSYVLIGNHDRINEKATAHALGFLENYTWLVKEPTKSDLSLWMVPYDHDSENLKKTLATIPEGSTIIMHQGVQSAHMGEYLQDKSSLPKECFANYRVISGHYHRKQDIKCGRPRKGAVGLFSYIGNPFSLTFGEASDGPKGFQVLMDDGLLEFVPTNLRKHIVLNANIRDLNPIKEYNPGDLVWVKLTGPKSVLDATSKSDLGMALIGNTNYRLDLIPEESTPIQKEVKVMKDEEILDRLIDNLPESQEQKDTLKAVWRTVHASR